MSSLTRGNELKERISCCRSTELLGVLIFADPQIQTPDHPITNPARYHWATTPHLLTFHTLHLNYFAMTVVLFSGNMLRGFMDPKNITPVIMCYVQFQVKHISNAELHDSKFILHDFIKKYFNNSCIPIFELNTSL